MTEASRPKRHPRRAPRQGTRCVGQWITTTGIWHRCSTRVVTEPSAMFASADIRASPRRSCSSLRASPARRWFPRWVRSANGTCRHASCLEQASAGGEHRGAFVVVTLLDDFLADERSHIGHARHGQVNRDDVERRRLLVPPQLVDRRLRRAYGARLPIHRQQDPQHGDSLGGCDSKIVADQGHSRSPLP